MQHTTVAKQSHILVKDSATISISAERYESQSNLMNIHMMNRVQKPLLLTQLHRPGKIPCNKGVKFLRGNHK